MELLNLPPAEEKPVVTVYNFLDKTGQRKSVDNIASFSTAVTQGGVEMVIDALKTAGDGTWFRVVERNGIDALIRERQILEVQETITLRGRRRPKGTSTSIVRRNDYRGWYHWF